MADAVRQDGNSPLFTPLTTITRGENPGAYLLKDESGSSRGIAYRSRSECRRGKVSRH
jgi:hypothetical protein